VEFTLLWAALTGLGGLWLGSRLVEEVAFDDLLSASIAGLAGGRVVEMLSQGLNPLTNPMDLLIVRGGVDTTAATVVALLTLYLVSGRAISRLDAAAPVAMFGLAGWHLGCLWRGACLGTASNLPWAWSEPGSVISRHPVEIYAALGFLAAAWLVSRLPGHPGARAGAGLALAAAIRLATEPIRLSIGGGPVPEYMIGLGIGIAVGVIAFSRGRPGHTAAPLPRSGP